MSVVKRLGFCAALAAALVCGAAPGLWAQEAESPAVRFARRDMLEIQQKLAALQEQIRTAKQIDQTLASQKESVAALEQASKEAEVALARLEPLVSGADKLIQVARQQLAAEEARAEKNGAAIENLQRAVDEAQKTRTAVENLAAPFRNEAVSRLTLRTEAEARLRELEVQAPKLKEQLPALEKQMPEVEKQSQSLEARLTIIERAPGPDPKAIREIGSFKMDRPTLACMMDADARFLFVGAERNSLQRWSLVDASGVALDGHKSWVRQMALLPDGRTLVSGAYEGRLIWWDGLAAQPTPIRTIDAHKGYVRAVSASPDGTLIATSGNDKFVRIWKAADGTLVRELTGHENHVYNVQFHPSGKWLFSGDLLGVIKQWDAAAWTHMRDLDGSALHKYDETFMAHCGGIRGMDFSPDGKILACAGIGEVTNAFAGVGVPTVVTFECETGKKLAVHKPAEAFQGTCWAVRFHPSGEFFVGAGGAGGGCLWFWKPGEEKSFSAFKIPANVYDISFHPDGLRLAAALYDHTVRLYDLSAKAAP